MFTGRHPALCEQTATIECRVRRLGYFISKPVEATVRWVLACVVFSAQINLIGLGLALSAFLLPLTAQAARLGTSTVSAGSAPPPAATSIDSFQPDLFTGRATTSVPIGVPPGRKGVQPSLALNYSSSSRNGWIGMGWSLDLGYIERSTRQGVPRYDATDTFTFLVQSTSSDLVQLPDGTYRAKDEGQFLRVTNLGGAGWEIRDKSGTRYLFGETAASRVSSGASVFRWALDKVIDTNGNTMTISYAMVDGIPYLSAVDYTGFDNPSLPATNRVEFALEDRADIESSYRAGFLIKTSKRLAAVEAKTLINGALVLSRRYELGYRPSQRTGRSLLATFRQVGADRSLALPTVKFSWQDAAAPTYTITKLDRPTGSIAWNLRYASYDCGHDNYGPISPYQIPPCGPLNYQPTVVIPGGSSVDLSSFHAAVGTDGSFRLTGRIHDVQVHAWTAVFNSSDRTLSLPQFGGWDVASLWIEDASGLRGPYSPGSYSFSKGWSLIHLVGYNQNDDRTDGFGIDGDISKQVDLMNATILSEPELAGDVNGDGVADVIDFNSSLGAWSSRTAQVPSSPIGSPVWASGFGNSSSLPVLGDWTASGRTGVAIYNNGSWRFATSDGSTFKIDALPGLTFGTGTPLTGDFNGDSTTDIATFDQGVWQFALGTGTGFAIATGGAGASSAPFNFISKFSLGEPAALPPSQIGWIAQVASYDCGHNNYGIIPPYQNPPCGAPNYQTSTVNAGQTLSVNGAPVSVDSGGNITIAAGQDRHFHLSTAVYLKQPKTISLSDQSSWDVAGLFVEKDGGTPVYIPNGSFNSISLAAGWSRIHITGYNQNQGITCGLAGNLATQVDLIRPDIVTVPTRPLQNLTGDWNGDGLTDIGILENNQFTAALSNGTTFVLQPAVTINGLPSSGVISADFNGDGLSDLAYYDHATGLLMVAYNTGGSFAAPVSLSSSLTFSQRATDDQIQVADFNGDSLPDPAVFNPITGNSELAFSQGGSPDLLIGIDNGVGGSSAITYQPSSTTGQSFLPFVAPVVTQTTISDGLGNSYTTTYSYFNGLYDAASKEFRGFGRVEVRDAEGNVTATLFNQDDMLKGRPLSQELRDSANNIWTRSEQTWVAVQPWGTSVASYFSQLTQTDEFAYDGNSTFKQTRSRLTYDKYGNVVGAFADGEVAKVGDERSTATTYALNETAWILDRPALVQSFDANGKTTAQHRYYYDGATMTATAPTKGNPTKDEVWLDRDRNGPADRWLASTATYDAYGNVLNSADALGHTVTNTYDTASQSYLVKVTNPLGHTQSLVYDTRFGVITSATDANGVTVAFEYDVLGRPTKAIGPLDTSALPTSRFDYDLTTVPARVTQFKRIQSGQPAELAVYSFSDGLGRTIQTRSPAQNASQQVVTGTVEFDSKGRVARQWTSYLDTAVTKYISRMSVTGLAAPVAYSYDPLGRLVATADPDGSKMSIGYNDWTVTTNDANGHVRKHTSDAYGRIVQVQEFTGTGPSATSYATTTYQYDSSDNLVQLIDAVGNTTLLSYDSLNRKISMTDPDMGTWTYAYDDVGKLTFQTDARGVTIQFGYDAINRETRKDYTIPANSGVPANQPAVVYAYDNPAKAYSKGKLTEVTDGSGSSSFDYDRLGRLVTERKSVDNIAYTFQRSYDLLGRLTALTYPNNDVATYTYNNQGGIDAIALQTPGKPIQPIVSSMTYNAAGQITRIVHGNGVTTDYTFDPLTLRLGHLHTAGPGGVSLLDFAYRFDAVGNVLSIADAVATATQSFSYDSLDRLIAADGKTYGSFTYAYNQVGNMTIKDGITQSYGTLNSKPHAVASTSTGLALSYDGNGNLASKTGVGHGAQTFTFDAENRLVEVDTAAATRHLNPGWNAISFPTVVGEVPIATAITNYTGNCDQLSRFNPSTNNYESFADTANNQFNTVNATTGYLLFVTNPNGLDVPLSGTPAAVSARQLTPGANLLPGPAQTMAVGDWLSGLVGGTDYTEVKGYNPATNSFLPVTTVRLGEAYSVTMLRAKSWSPPTTSKIETPVSSTRFVYDGDGGRIKKITPSGTTIFLGQSYEVAPNGLATIYVFASGQRIAARNSAGDVRIYHTDHLGSMSAATDRDGAVVDRAEYTPYGSATVRPNDTTYCFTGQRLDDESGLYYFNARYYDPEIGRFISADAIATGFASGQDLNRYSYANNNPVRFVDPSGHKSFWKSWGSSILQFLGAALAPFTGGASLWLSVGGSVWSGVQATQAGQFGSWAAGFGASLLLGGIGMPNISNPWMALGASALRGAATGAISGGLSSLATGGTFEAGATQGALGGLAGGLTSGVISSAKYQDWARGISNPSNWMRSLGDLAGKTWNLPNTAVGLTLGALNVAAGVVVGKIPGVEFRNNAIQLTNLLIGAPGGGALTLGNVQLYHDLLPDGTVMRYDQTGVVNAGMHEQAHTYESQLTGPFFLPIYFANGGVSANDPLERSADDYSGGVGSWWPW